MGSWLLGDSSGAVEYCCEILWHFEGYLKQSVTLCSSALSVVAACSGLRRLALLGNR